ncbi:MAG: AMIN domain-containing protein [Candidatus Sulfotelmatobacter sp.]
MKLTTGILAMAMMAGAAWAQSPDAIDNARSTAKSLQQTQANPAPKAAVVPAAAKPAPGAPAPAVKPAVAAKPASSSHNQLQRVNVVPAADGVQIEISSTQAVTPQVTKLTSPDRLLVELPETVVATAQNKIPVGTAGVKGVRIGMDGKTPPTTSVVVDLTQPLSYELTPGAAGKVVLTLHSHGGAPSVAKNTSAPAKAAPVKASAPATQSQAAAKPAAQASKPESKQPGKAAAPVTAKASAPAKTTAPAVSAPAAATQTATAPKAPKPEEKKWAMNGKRDPFFSPVVQTNGSGCSTGKKCLEIGAINLRGVVKSDTGFIAVVTNNLNKAYFLRENDPVFNGYVVKITGDSVVFQETIQDKLGKPFTREVVKRIFTPAV